MDADRIEREVVIAAAPERVWALVTQPGFWVSELDTPVLEEGMTVVPEHPEHGKFPVRVERVQPETYVSYRWASTFPGEEPHAGNSTLVEFSLAPERDSTRLSVAESGFAGLDASPETRAKSFEGNVTGWDYQLKALRQRAE